MYRLLVVFPCLFAATALSAEPDALSGDAIRDLVAGSTIELDTPLGSRIPVQYAEQGQLTGTAGNLAFYLGSASDNGRWWVSGNRLCHKWTKWFDAATQCVHLRQEGARLWWQRDDGENGTAMIARRPVILAQPAAPAAKVAAVANAAANSEPERPAAVTRPVDMASATANRPIAAPASPAITKVAATAAPANPVRRTGDAAKTASPPPLPRDSRMALLPARTPPAVAAKVEPGRPQERVLDGSFRVTGVDEFDVLNVRSGPSSDHSAISEIEPEARGIRIVGQCRQEWCPIKHRGVDGWVNSLYLVPEPVRHDNAPAKR